MKPLTFFTFTSVLTLTCGIHVEALRAQEIIISSVNDNIAPEQVKEPLNFCPIFRWDCWPEAETTPKSPTDR